MTASQRKGIIGAVVCESDAETDAARWAMTRSSTARKKAQKASQRAYGGRRTAQGGEVDAGISFNVGLPPRALRRNSLTASHGWRAKLVRDYQEQVWIAGWCGDALPGRDDMPWDRARLSLVWCHAGVAPDADNALASLKPLIDVLHTRSNRPLGIVIDDSAAHLEIMPVELRKVRHRSEERVGVTIERVLRGEAG